MANIKISELVEASALDGTEIIPTVQGGVTKKVTLDSIDTFNNKVKSVTTDVVNNWLVITYTDDSVTNLNLDDITTDINVTGATLDATTNVLTLTSDDGGADVTVDLSDFVNSSELTTSLDTKVSKVTSTDNAIVAFDGVDGDVKDSGFTMADLKTYIGTSGLTLVDTDLKTVNTVADSVNWDGGVVPTTTAVIGRDTHPVTGLIGAIAGTWNASMKKVTSTDNAIVRFDGTTGAVQNSSVIIDDGGNVGLGTSTFSIYDSNAGGEITSNLQTQTLLNGSGFTLRPSGTSVELSFDSVNSASKRIRHALIDIEAIDDTAGSESNTLNFYKQVSGTLTKVATFNESGNLTVNSYTKLGSDAPAIKHKILRGTTAATEGGTVSIAHGLANTSKIVSFTLYINNGTGSGVSQNYGISGGSVGFQAECSHSSTVFVVYNHPTNSQNILSKPFKILITYEE